MRPGVEVVSRPLSGRIRLARPAWDLRARYLAGVVALAGAYYAAAKVGYELEFAGPVAAIVWLPAGVAISFLCLGGLRLWPGVLVGDLLAIPRCRSAPRSGRRSGTWSKCSWRCC
jgi:hypothetical protein